MKTRKYPFKRIKKQASANSMRLALESRLLFDGTVAPVADTVIDDHSAQDKQVNQSDAALENGSSPVRAGQHFGDFFDIAALEQQPNAFAHATAFGSPGAPTLVVIDPRAPGVAQLLQNPGKDCDVRVLDPKKDGYEQITQILQLRGNTADLRIQAAELNGNQVLGASVINRHLSQRDSQYLMEWGDNFADHASISFHGATNMSGAWLTQVQALTGSRVDWSRNSNIIEDNLQADGKPADSSENTAVAAIPSGTTTDSPKSLVFVDTAVKDYQSLLKDIDPKAKVIKLDTSGDEVRQIADTVAQYRNLDALHIISHGEAGKLYLGNARLDSQSLTSRYADEMATIKASLTDSADILIYGCDMAEGAQGKAFVNAFAMVTGADVAASTNITGAVALNGDWNLEYNTGDIETKAISDLGYDGTLLKVNAQGGLLKFINASLVSGTAGTKGAVYKYANVANIGGIQVDVWVTVLDIVNATIIDINVANPNGGNPYTLINPDGSTYSVPDNVFFSPFISASAVNGHVDFGFAFKTTTGSPLIIENFFNNSIDIDGPEYVQYGGFQSYEVANPTDLVATPDTTTGAIKFSGTKDYNGLILNDVGRVQTKFNSVDSFTVSMGASSVNNGRQYGSVFGFDKFTSATNIVTAPSVNSLETLNTTPTITGTVGGTALTATDTFSVTVNGVTYAKGNPALTISGTSWSLAIPTSLALGTYEVKAVRNAALIDQTANELLVDIDTDKDGVLNTRDLDDDNDGLLDTVEGSADNDGDSIINSLDLDSDNDGISDFYESSGGAGAALKDANKDGTMSLAESITGGATGDGDANNDGLMDVFNLLATTNIINNADFATNLNYWTPSDATLVVRNTAGGVTFSGQNAATKQNTLYQDIATVAGQVYQVTYNMGYAGTLGPILSLKASALNGPSNSAPELGSTISTRDPANLTTAQEGFTFTAKGSVTRLFFADLVFDTLTADPTLDNVIVRPISTAPLNTDNDTVADYLDLDSDGDGIADTIEARPTSGYVANDGDVSNNDADKDGIIDQFDSNDGSTKLFGGSFINPVNTDAAFVRGSDSLPDYLDVDSDADLLLDGAESGFSSVTTDGNGDGIRDSLNATYKDPDGTVNNPTTGLANEIGDTSEVAYRETTDTDGDGINNSLDLDDDNDGILDLVENNLIIPVTTSDLTSVSTAPTTVTASDGSTATITYTKNGTTTVKNASGTSGGIPFVPFGTTNGSISGFTLGSAKDNSITAAFSTNVTGVSFSIADLNSNESVSIEAYDSAGRLIQDIRPYIVYLNTASQTLTNPSPTTSSGLINSIAKQTGISGSFQLTTHVDFYIPIPISRIVAKVAATSPGFPQFFITSLTTSRDTDSDGVLDSLDLDSDNDGISDLYESTGGTGNALKDTNKDGTVSLAEGNGDADKDGLMDAFDAVTTGATATTASASQGTTAINTDGDGRVDYLDLDSDGDGIADTVEARPTLGYTLNDGDVRDNDVDKDGIINLFDRNDGSTKLFGGSFTTPVNTDATFAVGADAAPDYLDLNSDGDAKQDAAENGFATLAADTNNDGISDTVISVSTPAYSDPDGIINNPQITLPNEIAATPEVAYREFDIDTDSDGILNEVDIDDDNDGILDTNEGNPINPLIAINDSGALIRFNNIEEYFANPSGGTSLGVATGWGSGDFLRFSDPSTGQVYGIGLNGSLILWSTLTDAATSFANGTIFGINTGGWTTTSTVWMAPDGRVYGINTAGMLLRYANINDFRTNTGGANLGSPGNGYGITSVIFMSADGVLYAIKRGTPSVISRFPSIADFIGQTNGTVIANVGANWNDTAKNSFFFAPRDTDDDGIVDSLDLDSDNDGISDLYESTGGTGVALKDTNKDGTISAADAASANTDANKDGLMDIYAATTGTTVINTDGDSRPDYLDLDSDGDDIADTVEARLTAGYVANDGDVRNNDTDKDGIIDLFDSNDGTTKLFGGTFVNPVNTDAAFAAGFNDTSPDYLDTDSDGDGQTDSLESGLSAVTTDNNRDGIRDSVIPVTTPEYSDPDGIIAPASLTNLQNPGTPEVDYREWPLLTINDPVVNENAGVMSFTLGLTGGALPRAVTVTFSVTNGSALAGSDYTAPTPLTVTIPANSATATITVPIINDTLFEGAVGETLNVNLLTAVGATIVDNLGVGTITDNDSPPRVSTITPATVVEGGNLVHTVTLTNPSATATTFALSLTGTTATAATDFDNILTNASFSNGVTYNATTGLISVPANITNFTVTYATVNDALNEASETTSLTIEGVTAVGTITDNDPLPTLSINDITVNEGAGTATFTVTLNAVSGQSVTVQYNTSNGTALSGSDYTSATGTLTFAPGTTTQTITVPITNDTLFEGSETLNVNLVTPTNATITDNVGIGSITDNDPQPSLSISDVSVNESAGTATFTISLSAVSGLPASVNYATANGTATSGADYTAATGSVSFAAGETSKTVSVTITEDTIFEGNETFNVNLTGAVNATIADAQGEGSIIDNDTAPVVSSVSNATAAEGAALVHTVTLSNASASLTTIPFTLAGNTAVINSDFLPALTLSNGVTVSGGNFIIPAGVTSFTVSYNTVDDALNEAIETTSLTVGVLNASGSITDNDPLPTLSVNDISVNEGAGTATFTVSLSAASGQTVTVGYNTSNGTALTGLDYNATTGILTFAPGVITQTITVPITNDTIFEGDESFNVNLASPVKATLTDALGVGTILENDPAPTVSSVSNATAAEGTALTHTVTLSNASSTATTIAFSLNGNTAVLNTDFLPALTLSNGVTVSGGNLIVPAGVTSFTVSYNTLDDALNEVTETTALTVGGVSAIGNITDNDPLPSLSVNDVSVNEGAGTATFTVTLSAASGRTVTVGYNTSNNTALAGSDFTSASGTLTFAPGVLTQTITVPITNDTIFEGDESFNVNLASPVKATLTDVLGVGTILENDPAPTVSSVSNATAVEGTALTHTVNLSNASASATTIAFTLAGNTAGINADFLPALSFSNGVTVSGGNLVIPAGVTSFTVSYDTVDDALNEAGETTVLTVGGISAAGNISDNDPLPSLNINDVSINETGGTATFTVTLDAASGQTVSVNYNTSNGKATAGSDYTAATGTVTFAPGETTKTISIPILNDSIVEGPETFNVNLSGVVNAVIADAIGKGTITDTSQLTVTISDAATVNEGGQLSYTVTLSGTATTDITVPVTYSGKADGSDFSVPRVASVLIKAGEATGTLVLDTKTDSAIEGPEDVIVTLGEPSGEPAGAPAITVADGEATGTITDTSQLTVTISDAATVNEGGQLSYTVTLSGTSTTDIIVPVTYSGKADGSDFSVPRVASVLIKAGEATGTLVLDTKTDSAIEGPEDVIVTLGEPSGEPAGAPAITVADGEATGTITDTSQLTVTISDAATVNEGGQLSYTVTLSGTSTTDIIVPVTYSGKADGSDFSVPRVASVLIKAGEATGTLVLDTKTDSAIEGPEDVIVTLGEPSGEPAGAPAITVADGEATGTITDTSQLTVTISDAATVNEGGQLSYTVTLSGTSTTDIIVPVTYSGKADGSDFSVPRVASVLIKAGEATGTLVLDTKTDSAIEGPEDVIVTLGEPSGEPAGAPAITVADGEATGTITDTSQLTVTISDAATVNEGGQLSYTVTLSGTSTTDIIVPVTYSGKADGSDFSVPRVASVLIKAGEATGTLVLDTKTDSAIEGPEDVIVTLGEPSGEPAGAPAITVADGEATGTITDTSQLTVTISDAATVNEGGQLSYTVTLSGTSTTDIIVPVTYSGKADGSDFSVPRVASVLIKAGEATGTLVLDTKTDSAIEGPEDVIVTLGEPSGEPAGAPAITVADGEATGTITDTSQLTVTISDAATVNEGGQLSYTVTLSGTSTTDIIVPVTYSGKADGSDFSVPRVASVLIKAGEATGTLVLDTKTDSAIEGPEDVIVTLGEPSGEPAGAPAITVADGEATGTITDTSQLTVTISDAATVNEGGQLSYTVTLSGTSTTDIIVPVTYSGKADGSDFSVPRVASVLIKAGEATGTLVLDTKTDSAIEGPEDVIVTLGEPSGEPVGAPAITVADGEASGIIIDVTVNQPPLARDDIVSTVEDIPLSVTAASGLIANDTDINATLLSVLPGIFVTSQGGSITINTDGSFSYTPALNFNGTDSINYTVTDGVFTDIGTLTIIVNPINDAPVAKDDGPAIVKIGVPATGNVLLNDIDTERDTLNVTQFQVDTNGDGIIEIFPVPKNGTVSAILFDATGQRIGVFEIKSDGSFVFTLQPGFDGSIPDITYSVSDGMDTATAMLSIITVSEAPIANDESVVTKEDTPLEVAVSEGLLAANNDPLLVIIQFEINGTTYNAGAAAHIQDVGILTVNQDGSYNFIPESNYNGSLPVVFYTITNGTATDTGTLSISVTPVNDAPEAGTDGPIVGQQGSPVIGNVLTNDRDPDGDSLKVTQFVIEGFGTYSAGISAIIPGVGVLKVNEDGSFLFSPDVGYAGSVPSVTYTVSDGLDVSTSKLTFADIPKSQELPGLNNIGAIIMLANPPESLPVVTDSQYSLLPFREPNPGLMRNIPDTTPSYLGLYGDLRDYDVYLTRMLRDQSVVELEGYSFSIPPGAFRHSNPNEQLAYKATKLDGTPLPSWLVFDPKLLIFSGKPPKSAENIEVMIKASDRYGKEAVGTFKVIVSSKPNTGDISVIKVKPGKAKAVSNLNLFPHAPGKLGLNEQLGRMGRFSRLVESRALLDSLMALNLPSDS